jgi:hypothetical protein
MRPVLALCLVCVSCSRQARSGDAPPTAHAASAPDAGLRAERVLVMEWSEAWNQHWAGNAGAEHANDAGRVTLTLAPNGEARGEDDGTTDRSVLDGDRYDETVTVWQTTWTGHWKSSTGGLEVALERSAGQCGITLSERQGAQQFLPEKKGCPELAQRLALTCRTQTLDVSPSLSDLTTAPRPSPALVCTAAATPTGPAAPQSWTFGEPCLARASARFAGSRYARCP